jgi:hypothetical protein
MEKQVQFSVSTGAWIRLVQSLVRLAALGILAVLPGDYSSVYLFAIIPSIFAIGFTFIVKDVRRASVE